MDGFFEKYGRVVIIAVAICFVLLYLTPMRNVVGSSINGFAGNFANKVGESIGAVKMPDEKEKSSMLISGPDFNKKIADGAWSITFTDEVAPKGAKLIDLTVAQDGDVVGWREWDRPVWKISTQDKKKVILFNTNSAGMFNYAFLKNIDFHNVDTSKVTNMRSMFYECSSLTNLDLSGFDTSNVTNMDFMFKGCGNLTSVNLSSFNTSNVKNMSCMFWRCYDLTNLDLSSFDTSNVTDMNWMFSECSDLTSVNLSSFDTSNVENMEHMFSECSSLTVLDLSSFNGAKANKLQMFSGCNQLTKVLVQSQKELNHFSHALYTPSNVKFEIK